MRRRLGIIFLHLASWLFIIVGVAAFFVPIVPGFIFVIVGIYLISLKSSWVKDKLDRFIERHPHLKHIIVKTEKWRISAYEFVRGALKRNNDGKTK